ncbi:MAG: SGNH/GDSL hydrolase family protein [Planctomycetes bacterium]|nr:SGNH/GDSL hydrolase family protein [Planctomycetota bacterium]
MLGPPGPWLLCAVFVLALEGVALLCSESVLREAFEGRAPGWLTSWVAAHEGRTPAGVRAGTLAHLRSLQLAAVALLALYLAVRVHLAAGLRPRSLPITVLAWWLGVELLVAPHLSFGDWNIHYRILRNLDHRPTQVGGGFNSDSVVAREESGAFRPEDFNLIFLGDSFTMGLGVDPGTEAFPVLVGDALAARHPAERFHTANFGWVSSSPFLSHRRLVDSGARYAPDLVVLAVDMTDFADDLRYQRVLERHGIYWLYDKIPLTLRLVQAIAPVTLRRVAAWSVGGIPARRFFVTDAPLEETRRWMDPLAENCDRVAAWCREQGARFVLVVLPRSYQYSAREAPRDRDAREYAVLGPYCLEPFRFFDELRPTKDYPIVSLLDDFRANTEFPTCFEDDAHWTPLGHRVAARALVRELAPIVDEILAHGR